MNKSMFKSMSGIVLASFLSASAIADPMLLVSHNATVGPKKEALIACVEAARKSPEFGNGLVLSRGAMKSGQGGRILRLSGATWENGARVPITVICTTSKAGEAVANVARVHDESKLATTK